MMKVLAISALLIGCALAVPLTDTVVPEAAFSQGHEEHPLAAACRDKCDGKDEDGCNNCINEKALGFCQQKNPECPSTATLQTCKDVLTLQQGCTTCKMCVEEASKSLPQGPGSENSDHPLVVACRDKCDGQDKDGCDQCISEKALAECQKQNPECPSTANRQTCMENDKQVHGCTTCKMCVEEASNSLPQGPESENSDHPLAAACRDKCDGKDE